jgi:hypothetical protein
MTAAPFAIVVPFPPELADDPPAWEDGLRWLVGRELARQRVRPVGVWEWRCEPLGSHAFSHDPDTGELVSYADPLAYLIGHGPAEPTDPPA